MIELSDADVAAQTSSASDTAQQLAKSSNKTLASGGEKAATTIKRTLAAIAIAGLGSGCANMDSMNYDNGSMANGFQGAAQSISEGFSMGGRGGMDRLALEQLEHAANQSDLDLQIIQVGESTVAVRAPEAQVFGDGIKPKEQYTQFLDQAISAFKHDALNDSVTMQFDVERNPDIGSVRNISQLADFSAENLNRQFDHLQNQQPFEIQRIKTQVRVPDGDDQSVTATFHTHDEDDDPDADEIAQGPSMGM